MIPPDEVIRIAPITGHHRYMRLPVDSKPWPGEATYSRDPVLPKYTNTDDLVVVYREVTEDASSRAMP